VTVTDPDIGGILRLIVTNIYQSPESIVAACLAAKALAPCDVPADPPNCAISGAPAWYPFEHTAWAIGEEIRQSFQAHPRLKRDLASLHAVLDVARYRNLRRGRESFVMALGFTGAATHASALAELIDDPDISGHVVDTLLKMRAPGYSSQVSPLTAHKRAWVRRLAERYIARPGVRA